MPFVPQFTISSKVVQALMRIEGVFVEVIVMGEECFGQLSL